MWEGQHPPGTLCPARETTYFICNRKGHYRAQCFSKLVAGITEEPADEDGAFMGVVEITAEKSWTATIVVRGKPIILKLDTGAEVSAIPKETYNTLHSPHPKLIAPTQTLFGPAQQALNTLGQFSTPVSRGKLLRTDHIHSQWATKESTGTAAIRSLQLLSCIDAINSNQPEYEIPHRFASLFQGLGNLGELYSIKLEEDAQPHAIYSPRNVPLPLRGKVQEAMKRMETVGVISRVIQPTPWCAERVVVPKPSGAVHICVILKPLNENVLREVYPIPAVSHTLALLTGAKKFSKIDAIVAFNKFLLPLKSAF